jgi:hypothetical protein
VEGAGWRRVRREGEERREEREMRKEGEVREES